MAYSVPEGASLSKVYSMFRHLGLRHLCVVPDDLRLSGIITRHDLQARNLRGGAVAAAGPEEAVEEEDVALVRSALRGGGMRRRIEGSSGRRMTRRWMGLRGVTHSD